MGSGVGQAAGLRCVVGGILPLRDRALPDTAPSLGNSGKFPGALCTAKCVMLYSAVGRDGPAVCPISTSEDITTGPGGGESLPLDWRLRPGYPLTDHLS